ncbi:hypothetical protein M0804_007890 [Polistes exclamans]|nr:hypothetical protein M0804_007890 [Polistes exclamans]
MTAVSSDWPRVLIQRDICAGPTTTTTTTTEQQPAGATSVEIIAQGRGNFILSMQIEVYLGFLVLYVRKKAAATATAAAS